MDHEKVLPPDEKTSIPHPTVETRAEQAGAETEWRDGEDFMTRNGLNLKSFQRRPKPADGGLVILDKSMKTRHLHMIAIGGSIGAGFFVGSGGALNKGVSYLTECVIRTRADALYRALLLSSLTSLLWVS
jgi:amino acid transporter